MKAKPPCSAGTSLTCKLALHGDPTWLAALGPVLAWHKELWLAFLKNKSSTRVLVLLYIYAVLLC